MNWIAAKKPVQRGEPNLAALLTWFLPGAGHVYIGRPLFGLLAFAVVQGFYFIGLRLSHGMTFEFLQDDLRGPFAGALTPEAANLGALIWHMKEYGFGPGFPRPWPEHIHLGAWLTAMSGILNVCLMISAHVDARRAAGAPLRGLSPARLVFLGWLIPGLGHIAQRRYLRGAIVFVLLCGLLLLGTSLADGSNLDRERHFYYWGGQFLAGLPVMLLELAHGHPRLTHDIPYVDAGLVLVCLAGLLNVLALLDVFTVAEAEVFDEPSVAAAEKGGARAAA